MESRSAKSTPAPQSAPVVHDNRRDEPEAINEIRLLGSLHPTPNREERIAIAAYWRAVQRQFAPGHELDDWLEAEREVDQRPEGRDPLPR